MRQEDWVLEQLKRRKRVTPQTALEGCGCFRLAAVVYRLREKGHNVLTTMKYTANGGQYAEYTLAKGK